MPLPPPKTNAALVGQQGEEQAVALLAKSGYRILARNWRPTGVKQGLELDIVAKVQGSLVFVEVKTRSARAGGGIPPLAGFTLHKQQKMVRAAREYLAAHNAWHMPCRFDMICVTLGPCHTPTLEHYSDVICIGHSLDSSNAAWQPW